MPIISDLFPWVIIAGLLALMVTLWRMWAWKGRARKAEAQVLEREGELARLRGSIALDAESYRDIQAQLLLATSDANNAKLALASYLSGLSKPPTDAAGAIEWLKQAAKEDR